MALLGMFNVHRHGAINSAAIVLYALTSCVSGYCSCSFYTQIQGQRWVWNIILTSALFSGETTIFCIYIYIYIDGVYTTGAHCVGYCFPQCKVLNMIFPFQCVLFQHTYYLSQLQCFHQQMQLTFRPLTVLFFSSIFHWL